MHFPAAWLLSLNRHAPWHPSTPAVHAHLPFQQHFSFAVERAPGNADAAPQSRSCRSYLSVVAMAPQVGSALVPNEIN